MIYNLKEYNKKVLRYSQGLFLIPFSRDFLITKIKDENGNAAELDFCIINLGESVKDFFAGFGGLNIYIGTGYNAVFYRNKSEKNIDLTFFSSTDNISSSNLGILRESEKIKIDEIAPKSSRILIEYLKTEIEKIKIVNIPYGFKGDIDIYDDLRSFIFYFETEEKNEDELLDFRFDSVYGWECEHSGINVKNPLYSYESEKEKIFNFNLIVHSYFSLHRSVCVHYFLTKQKIINRQYNNVPPFEIISENTETSEHLYSREPDFFINANGNIECAIPVYKYNNADSVTFNDSLKIGFIKNGNINFYLNPVFKVTKYGWQQDFATVNTIFNHFCFFYFINKLPYKWED